MRKIRGFSMLVVMLILFLWQSSPTNAQSDLDLQGTGNPNQTVVNQLPLVLDGINQPQKMAFQLSSGRSVITLETLQDIIGCQSGWGAEGELVLIYDDMRIQLYPGRTEMLVNAIPQALEFAPFCGDNGELFLPLRAVGEAMHYQIIYDQTHQSILLNSPGYQPLPEATVVPDQVSLPVIDFQSLPTWGSILSIPGLTDLWKEEQIITGYFTRLVNSPVGRTTNIILSSGKVNGIILQPGEVFSFNRTVGPRTVQTGYQNAKVFAGKKVVTGVGGGVCQTSSTLYNMALEAGLKIVERYPHSLRVVYAPAQRDATVSWGGADLKFRNNKDYPVKILCLVNNGYVFAVLVRAEIAQPNMAVPAING